MTNHGVSSIQFDDVRVEPRNFKVYKAGAALPLEPKTFLLLAYLIENRDRLVDKKELLDAVWKDVAVTENALTREVGKLRRSLGDDPKTPRYIETVHTRGYRFIGAVRMVDDAPQEPSQASLPVPPGVPFSQAAELRGPESRRHISKWLPYKFFVALSAVGLLIATGFLLLKPAQGTKTAVAHGGNTTLAVLPFRSLSADMDDRYIGLGIADALITKLGNSIQLSIEPLSTVLHYADAKQDSLAIGRAMHVDYVLEGKFQKLGDRLRITVQLLCIACDANSRWAASFDETSTDLFQVQDSISQKVAAALPLELSGDEQKRLAKRETSNPQAQLAFAKGKLSLSEDTQESDEKAIEYEQSAISLDPGYGMAWAVLSDGYRRREWYGGSPADFLPLVREAATKARSLDDDVPYTHSMLGLIAYQYDWDFGTAEREYKRARELQPSWIHQWYARYLLAMNRPSEAEQEYKRFTRAAPFSVAGRSNFAQFLFLTGQYPKALEQLHQTLLLRPDYPPALELLGLIYEQQGLTEKAEQEFQKASDLSHGLNGLAALGHLYATSGRLRHTQQVLDEMRAQQYYVSPFDFAVIHAGLGYHRRALAELQRAYKERSLSAQSLRFDPRLNDLRGDPDYHELAKRLGVD
ncbi:MAG TPA: winged helix-turn-helix domain-containing protein [Bryobacteraceae bacterium]|nr:winged helix-turn-helix domain-containing protein [Bryobacteraceae bacterium]